MLKPNVLMKGEFIEFEGLLKERFSLRRYLVKGDMAYGERERSNKNVFYVLKGMLDSYFVHEEGEKIHLLLRGPGTIFPLYYSYESTSMDRVLVSKAIENTELIIIPKSQLLDIMIEFPTMAIAMVDAYGKLATYLDYALASRLYDSVKTKVCGFILLHSANSNLLRFTHEEIASAIGSSRAKVSEVLSALKKEGIIDTSRGRLRVIDREELTRKCSYVAGL